MVEVQHQPRASAGIDQAEIIATLRVTKRNCAGAGFATRRCRAR
jgi:hypothetical protein